MDYQQLVFSGHAIRQIFHRGISKDEVIRVVKTGQVIADYPDDKPYPSSLIFAFAGDRAIHVVFAFDEESKTGIIVTAYVPDLQIWTEDFKSRRDNK